MIKKYTLELIVFLSGAVVMVLEIVGVRLVAPYFGTSLPIWTTIIGIVLASLSIGYYYGGTLADKGATYQKLSFIMAGAGALIGFTMLLQNTVFAFISGFEFSLITRATLAILVLFAPAAVLLGIVSPYAVRLRIDSVSTSGATVGRLSALSALGSIVGTMLAGLVLLGLWGSRDILLMLALLQLALSLLVYRQRRLVLIVIMLAVVFILGRSYGQLDVVADIDTAYNRVWVVDKGNIRVLSVGGVSESAIYLSGNPELVFGYTRLYQLVEHFMPGVKRALMLGGAGYTYPRDFLRKNPQATIDVVEIDPGMTQIARDYFRLKDDPRLRVIHEDGRIFLNESSETYDVFFGDAFGSYYSIPFQLTTREAVQKIYERLSDDGVAFVNLIGSIGGETGKFIRAEYHTYKERFPHVYLFPVIIADADAVQNIMLIAFKNETEPSLVSMVPEFETMLGRRWTQEIARDVPILTDDFAPVDQYIAAYME